MEISVVLQLMLQFGMFVLSLVSLVIALIRKK